MDLRPRSTLRFWPTGLALTYLTFSIISEDHHLDGVVYAEPFNRRLASQPFKRAFSTLDVTVTHEPPR